MSDDMSRRFNRLIARLKNRRRSKEFMKECAKHRVCNSFLSTTQKSHRFQFGPHGWLSSVNDVKNFPTYAEFLSQLS